MPSIKIQEDILKKEYMIKIKEALEKINGSKTSHIITLNGNIKTVPETKG